METVMDVADRVGERLESRPARSVPGAGPPLLLRATEVAALLGLGRSTVFALMASGQLPTVRVGRAVRVPRAGLERWISQQTGEAA